MDYKSLLIAATIAELQAAGEFKQNQIVMLQGNAAVNDGKAAFYVWDEDDTSTDTSSTSRTVIAVTGKTKGRWLLMTDSYKYQGDPSAQNTTGTLEAAQLLGGIITSTTAAAVAATVRTGALMDDADVFAVGDSFDWSVINTGANTFTVTASTGHTVVGAAVVAGGTSGLFRTRKTATDTFVTYRIG